MSKPDFSLLCRSLSVCGDGSDTPDFNIDVAKAEIERLGLIVGSEHPLLVTCRDCIDFLEDEC